MRAVLNNVIYLFSFFSPLCFENPVWFWLWKGLTSETPSCFLPVENLNFHAEVLVRVLFVANLSETFFFFLCYFHS